MAILSVELKTEIVLRLARYGGYSEIAKSISSEYGVLVSRFQVRSYDPTKPTFAGSEKWRVIFETERNRYCEEVSTIPISYQAYRLNQLQTVVDRAMEAGNLILAMKALEQAAKEVGGVHSNKRSIEMSQSSRSPYADLSQEERRNRVGDILRDALEKAKANKKALA